MIPRWLDRVGIVYRWRAAMRLELRSLLERRPLPEPYQLGRWDPARLEEVAAVDYAAYRGTVDGRLYRGYIASPEGCRRMWTESIGGRFGRFDPERTLLLLREEKVCGDVMVSQTLPGEAFIGNLAVHPEHRGGTGRALLLACLWGCKEAGYERASLAVTYDNQRAFRLYQNLGFQVVGRFPILTWQPPLGKREPRREVVPIGRPAGSNNEVGPAAGPRSGDSGSA